MVTCKNCNTVFKSNFCPNCGSSYTEGGSPYPYKFVTYLHGDKEDESKSEVLQDLELEWNSDLANSIIGCDYEIKFEWEVTLEGVELITVDGKRLYSPRKDK